MNIVITSNGIPIYEQIAAQIKGMILLGKLKKDDPLPSLKTLAQELRISVNTTARAYKLLESEGFIEIQGCGCFAAADQDMIKEHNLQEIESLLANAVDIAIRSGIDQDELVGLFNDGFVLGESGKGGKISDGALIEY